jgi:hypothetical protein
MTDAVSEGERTPMEPIAGETEREERSGNMPRARFKR